MSNVQWQCVMCNRYVRDNAGKALVNFIYNKVSANLADCCATQIFLIGHSHGVTVNTIAMRNINAEKLAKFGAEIPLVIGLNGIGTSRKDNDSRNEWSTRDCYIFPNIFFKSLGNDKKTTMYNFYAENDGVVPPGFDRLILFPYNYKWEYDTLLTLQSNVFTYPIAIFFSLVQVIRLIEVAIMCGDHNCNRKNALYVDNAKNINMHEFIDENYCQSFYYMYMQKKPNIPFIINQIFTSSAYIAGDPITFFLLFLPEIINQIGVNGDNDNSGHLINATNKHHQLPRIYKTFKQCIRKINSINPEILADKEVSL